MDRGDVGNDDAAEIVTEADLLPLRLARHHVVLTGNIFLPKLQLARCLVILRRTDKRGEAAAAREMALDALALDPVIGEFERSVDLAVNPSCEVNAARFGQLGEIVPEGAAHRAGVAGAGARAEIFGVENQYLTARLQQGQRRGQAGIARADHHNIGLRRQRVWRGGRARFLPPIGRRFEVRHQN